MTDVELDDRITTLEENSGSGNSGNGEAIALFSNLYGPLNAFDFNNSTMNLPEGHVFPRR